MSASGLESTQARTQGKGKLYLMQFLSPFCLHISGCMVCLILNLLTSPRTVETALDGPMMTPIRAASYRKPICPEKPTDVEH